MTGGEWSGVGGVKKLKKSSQTKKTKKCFDWTEESGRVGQEIDKIHANEENEEILIWVGVWRGGQDIEEIVADEENEEILRSNEVPIWHFFM